MSTVMKTDLVFVHSYDTTTLSANAPNLMQQSTRSLSGYVEKVFLYRNVWQPHGVFRCPNCKRKYNCGHVHPLRVVIAKSGFIFTYRAYSYLLVSLKNCFSIMWLMSHALCFEKVLIPTNFKLLSKSKNCFPNKGSSRHHY